MNDKTEQELELEFLEDWIKNKERNISYQCCGLCIMYRAFIRNKGAITYYDKSLLLRDFIRRFGSEYPFNRHSLGYSYECSSNSMHKNPKRIGWVINRIEELKNEQRA